MTQITKGQGVSYGSAHGFLKPVFDDASAKKIQSGDIVYSDFLTPRLAMIAKRAEGFVICGNEADHTIAYLREFWKPTILVDSLKNLQKEDEVTIDGFSGEIYKGRTLVEEKPFRKFNGSLSTKLYLQQSIPEVAERAGALNTDGVGLFRLNLIIQEIGKHPEFFFLKNKEGELEDILYNGILKITRAFYPRPVWIRTMDFDSAELALFEGGEVEKEEANPMLGLRGLARDLKYRHNLELQYRAIKRVVDQGFSNIGIEYPLVRDVSEYREAKNILREIGLEPHKDVKVGSIFETPSSCLQIREFIEEGLDLAFFGFNDMVQYTMAVDRTNLQIKHMYDPSNDAVLYLLFHVLKECKKNSIETSITFLSPLKSLLGKMIAGGLTSITVQSDRLREIGTLLEQVEKEMP